MDLKIEQQSNLGGSVEKCEVLPKPLPVEQTPNFQESARERYLRKKREWRLRHRKPGTRPVRRPGEPITKEFLMANCTIDSEKGCWLWNRAINKNGRGVVRVGKRGAVTISRVGWELWKGEIPEGLLVCHHCDDGRCFNPDHLFLGTHKDNKHDSIVKGRAYPIWERWNKS